MELPFAATDVSRLLLAWYGREGRDLPWRQTRDPYRIWLSEIMLQQTTVAAVIPYYERFLLKFPTLTALAEADLDAVLEVWVGLGYYSRARNLHTAARQVVQESGGRFPGDLDGLMALPGVGRSTAGAILSIAFDTAAPILDGNVRRVLVRLFAWTEDPRGSRADKQLWAWAEALTPSDRPHDYAQAIMDLGATVCLPREPRCPDCPLAALCRARAEGLAGELPRTRPKKTIPTRRQAALIVSDQHRVLVQQRPAEGLLGGLWEFPVVDLPDAESADQAVARLAAEIGLKSTPVAVAEIAHTYSHFKLSLSVCAVSVPVMADLSDPTRRTCGFAEMEDLPLHGAHRKAWESVRQSL